MQILLKKVGLLNRSEHYPSQLSGGEKQRISIARAIVRDPELLILDEATTELDPETEERILKTISSLTKKGITAVAVSHQTAVLDIADQVFKLENGAFKKIITIFVIYLQK